jgi:dTDP-glucose 4,6-dehydratase
MNILVACRAAFNGFVAIRHIIRITSDRLVNLDKRTYTGHFESLAEVNDSECYAFEQLNSWGRIEVARVLREHQPDAVIHLYSVCYSLIVVISVFYSGYARLL